LVREAWSQQAFFRRDHATAIDTVSACDADAPMEISKSSGRDQSLDVIRGVAILLAMGWHLNAHTGIPPLDLLLEPGHRFGWAGVDLFFVLSGFLIGGLVLREREKTGGFDAKGFLLRRAIRLWPVVWVFLAAQLIISDKSWNTFLFQNLLHVQNFWVSTISHLWSLAVEEHFYLVLALTLLAMSRVKELQKPLLIGLLAIMLVAPVLRFGALAIGASYRDLQWQTQYRADALACGVLLALLKQNWPVTFSKIQSSKAALLVLFALSVGFLFVVRKNSFWGVTLGLTVAYIGAGSFLMLVYRSHIVKSWRYVFAPISMIGVYSYSMYVWHMAASNLAVRIASKLGVTSAVIVVPAKYAAAIGVAIVMFYLVERPAMLLRERFAPARSRELV
jgi:peptidoglycan/LPS O-acetylase OafA/YrhL